MWKKTHLMHEALKVEHEKRAGENLQTAQENFEITRLDKSETLEMVIASEKASLTVSNKRAYFSGDYIGASNENSTEAVNLTNIKKLKLKTKLKKEFISTRKYLISSLVILLASIITIILYVNAVGQVDEYRYRLNNVTASNADDLREYFYNYGMDSTFINAIQYASEEIAMKEKQIKSEMFQASDTADIYLGIMIATLSISAIIVIVNIINFIKERKTAKYNLLEVRADKHMLGIEIRDASDYEKINNIILVAKSNVGQSEIIVQTPIEKEQNKQVDKAERLIELSKLYEQHLITEEEFTKLKNNVMNS